MAIAGVRDDTCLISISQIYRRLGLVNQDKTEARPWLGEYLNLLWVEVLPEGLRLI